MTCRFRGLQMSGPSHTMAIEPHLAGAALWRHAAAINSRGRLIIKEMMGRETNGKVRVSTS
jgi:hypothetical protein